MRGLSPPRWRVNSDVLKVKAVNVFPGGCLIPTTRKAVNLGAINLGPLKVSAVNLGRFFFSHSETPIFARRSNSA